MEGAIPDYGIESDMNRLLVSIVSVLLLIIVAGCDNAPKKPRVSTRVKAEGAAKDVKAKDASPVKPGSQAEPDKTANDSKTAERTTLRPLVTGTEWVPEMRAASEQEVAAMALGRIGPAAVPPLMQALRHRDAQVRRQSALVLARIGPPAREAVSELTGLLDDPDEEVRKAAARALGQIGPEAADAVPALMRQLVEPTPTPPRR
jgi:hypothetical protein